ncbi:hypothetical protein [Sulfurimonas sp.]
MTENSNILIHQNESKLKRDSVIWNYQITASNGKNYDVTHCNLD